MGKLLLITGDLAAGKSTFAQLLSRRYHIPLLCKDAIKEVLGDTIGFTDRAENLKLSKAAAELMAFLFLEAAKLDHSLILESNFRLPELEQLHQIARAHDYQILTLILRGDIQVLHKRYLKRMRHENRHPVHLSTRLDIFEEFSAHTLNARKTPVPGRSLTVDATELSYQSDPALLSAIDAFMLH